MPPHVGIVRQIVQTSTRCTITGRGRKGADHGARHRQGRPAQPMAAVLTVVAVILTAAASLISALTI